ncbi:DUF5677 domain-containing protein [Paraburkholderia phenazinium]|uniref:Uncharacterized protein n=1 Tax=Paraburkholderia phenazinium TaxID=60549 RepID=A0A1N6KYA2_9BURK|nr:DUF5677 domain-containing protein [Paraburkholderia phenazinium]SIO61534.1 hypothetical protein SAMN05444165_5262 [Paraburkholderia phenazinium]
MDKFNDIGFLSPELATWADQLRADFAFEFGIVERIDRLAMRVLFDLPAEEMTEAHMFANLCFGRALQAFQSAILLAQKGALVDSRTLVRSCTETVIALAACRVDDSMPAQIKEDADQHRSKLANALLAADRSKEILSADRVASLAAVVKEVAAEYGARGPRKINWAEKANAGGVSDLYDMAYRTMSGDGAHCTVWSLSRYHSPGNADEKSGFVFRPDRSDIEDTLFTACAAILHALATVIEWFDLSPNHAEMELCVEGWKQMRGSGANVD